jgi:integrase
MKWSDFDGDSIEVRQQKTDELLSIPCHKDLRAELENMPRIADTILVGERGATLTGSSLSVMVRRQLREMGVDGYAIHGLRKNAAVALADAGCAPHEIAAITGHRTLGMVAHYAKRHDQRLAARSARDKLERAQSGKLKNGTR